MQCCRRPLQYQTFYANSNSDIEFGSGLEVYCVVSCDEDVAAIHLLFVFPSGNQTLLDQVSSNVIIEPADLG